MNINSSNFSENTTLPRLNSWGQEPARKKQASNSQGNSQDNSRKLTAEAGVLNNSSAAGAVKKTFEKNRYLPELTRGGTSVVGGVLQRLHSLADKASNPALSPEERDAINAEFLRARAEIYQLEDTLRLNTLRLDSPSFSHTAIASVTSAIRGLSQPGQILNIVA